MGVRKQVFEAMHVIREPVTARQLHERARSLRFTPENIECAMRALVRRGLAIEIPSQAKKRDMPSKFVLVAHASEKLRRAASGDAQEEDPRSHSWLVLVTPEDERPDDRIVKSLMYRGYRVTGRSVQDGCNAVRFVREVREAS